jgi:heavy metal translocating P-type ATPase
VNNKKVSTVVHVLTALYLLFLGGVYFFAHEHVAVEAWNQILFFSVLVGSLPFALDTFIALRKGMFGVDVIAIIAMWAGLATGETVASAIVLFMLSGGELLEIYAEHKARSSLEKLLERTPHEASIYRDGKLVDVRVRDVVVGDVLAIRKGEIVPIDGVVETGTSTIDESVINGEPIPKDVKEGDVVMSGTTNTGGFFTLRATATYEKSVFAGIVHLVKQAEDNKAPTVRMANKYSAYFTIVTITLATLAFFKDPKLAVAVLVVATPCPLILAAPIAFIAGMSRASKRGIIVKHGGVFESLGIVKAFFFDKTGTLTLGIPKVSHITLFKDSVDDTYIIQKIASLEQVSKHILAEAVVAHARDNNITLVTPSQSEEVVGKGVAGSIDNKTYTIGNSGFLKERGVDVSALTTDKHIVSVPAVYLAEEGVLLGGVVFSDTLRKNAHSVIRKLQLLHKGALFMLLTGDKEERAHEVGDRLGFSHVTANCLPEDKEKMVAQYEGKDVPVAMIGDGVNDSPSLARATVGIALGSHGATVATDVADAVVMVDDISRVYELDVISNDTVRIAKQSIIVGMGLSFVAMAFAYAGVLPPVEGAVLQEGIDVLVILNALRAL